MTMLLGQVRAKMLRPRKRTELYANYLVLKIKKKYRKHNVFGTFLGGDKRDRTADLLNAIQALSQLSYTPIFCCCFLKLDYYSNRTWICQEAAGIF